MPKRLKLRRNLKYLLQFPFLITLFVRNLVQSILTIRKHFQVLTVGILTNHLNAKIMKTRILLPAVLCCLLSLNACRNTENSTSSTLADSSLEQTMTDTTAVNRGEGMQFFLEKAANAGNMEVELGKMATSKASNVRVKKFAEKMVKDHTKTNDNLKKLADKKKLTIPTSIPEADQNHINEMAKLSGAQFDKHYMDMMVKDHIKTLDLFKSATTSGDIDVRRFAAKTLRMIEGHYKLATDLSFDLK
ncbi:DUF4142 domain-containing protein [Pedobacter panaciterrae]|uniref:DUF4142 domain-containing protein n=1 Tax=Pedobacter panaciterrae TaxID=363849 RepID=UPI0025965454|nr:DUF4142 domain-containing protein [uncultured Pedobacter sp.]